jgi:hypothetical protein
MNAEQYVSVMVAVTGLLVSVAGLWRSVTAYRHEVNSRLDQLIQLTATSSHAAGVLEGAASADSPDAPPATP